MSLLPSFNVPQLQKTKGPIVIVNSQAAQLRIAFSNEYCTSKPALIRFAEFITVGRALKSHYCHWHMRCWRQSKT